MKKKLLVLFLAVLCIGLLSGCCLSHEWEDATCEEPKTCAKCDKTEGEALGHDWEDATCEDPETCSVCGETQGEALGHAWEDATCAAPKTCTECGETEGEALEHTFGEAALNDASMLVAACSACGEEEVLIDVIDLLSGEWSSWYVYTAEATEPHSGYSYTANADGTFTLDADYSVTGTWTLVSYSQDGSYDAFVITMDGSDGTYIAVLMQDVDPDAEIPLILSFVFDGYQVMFTKN